MKIKILIAEDEQAIRESLKLVLEDEGYIVDTASDGLEALNKIKSENFDLVITDIKMPQLDGMELLEKGSQISPDTFFIIITAYASVNSAIAALRAGAYDYLIKPLEFDDLLIRIRRLLDYRKLSLENRTLRQRISSSEGYRNLIGKSSAMKKVFKIISQVAPTNSNILIVGKSGTGKELVARAIHANSKRKDKIFLPINCGAISPNLIESELFGHKKGAFTGATEDKQGLFKVADKGTLFLDEIGDLPIEMQVKLLRAIEEKQFLPVGATVPVKTDVRIIAATNKDLEEKIKKGEFRDDLYYRLNVVEIKLPPLNQRKEDIPLLVNHFIEKYCNEMGKKILTLDNNAMRALLNYDWKGGVRELENVIERAVIFASGDVITLEDLSENLQPLAKGGNYPDSLKEAIKDFERNHILHILRKFNFDKEKTANALHIGLSSLYRKMDELNIPIKNEAANN